MKIKVKVLTKKDFAPYGDVIEPDDMKQISINNGSCIRHHDLSRVDCKSPGSPAISIFVAKPFCLPHTLEIMERHPLGSQAFLPQGKNRFCVVVTDGDDTPDFSNLGAYMTEPGQGVNIKRNVWHHPLITMEKESLYWVVDWVGEATNLQEFPIDEKIEIVGNK